MAIRSILLPFVALILALLTPMPGLVSAQVDWDALAIQTIALRERVTLISVAGGNVAVLAGADGVLVVDSGYQEVAGRILDTIGELAAPESTAEVPAQGMLANRSENDPRLRYLINTHWHFDHTSGNEAFARAGAVIIAHERVRRLLAEDQVMAALGGREVPALPREALPAITFNDHLNLECSGEVVHVVHMPYAHTDGDVIVHFRNADVIHMGDIFFNGMYPFIDVDNGGSIVGMARAVQEVLDHSRESTLFIPGHGPLADRNALQRYGDMLRAVGDRIEGMIAQDMSREEVKAARPTADFDPVWAGKKGTLEPDFWVGLVYDGLVRAAQREAAPRAPGFEDQ